MNAARRSHLLLSLTAQRVSPHTSLRVAGTDLGDFYKDDNGNLWRFTLDGALVRAETDAYGGTTTESRLLRSQVISDIDRRAQLLGGLADIDASAASSAEDTPSTAEVSAADDAIGSKALDGWKPSGGTTAPSTAAGTSLLRSIQTKLAALGYGVGSSGADGKMGPATAAAIGRFKQDHGIKPADESITPDFRSALIAARPPTSTSKISGAAVLALGVVGSGVLAIASAPPLAISAPFVIAVGYVALRK